jgi:DNA-binding MarR family transcriptional regulator
MVQYATVTDQARSSVHRGPRGRGSPPVAFLLAQVGAHAANRFAERLTTLDLAPSHAGVLRIIAAATGLSQRALGEQLGIFPSRLVTLLDELASRGLVERRDDPDDRRSYALYLTEKGREALAAIGRIGREHSDELLAALSDAERAQLGNLLQRIADDQGLKPGVHPGFRKL